MTDCVIVQPISPCGVTLLRRAGLVVVEAPAPDLSALRGPLETARAVITRNLGFSAEAIDAAPALQVIVSHGTGTDRIDKNAAARRGIRVVNTPGTNAAAVAEHSLALILACSRRVVSADQATRRGNWAYREAAHPVELAGRCLGLVGYGHVARHLARMASSLGLGVLVLSGHATATELARDGVRQARDLDELLAEADIVSLHGLPDHAPRLTAAHFQRMRPEAIVINTARGSLIDEAALADALHRGAISAAALDVFASEPLPADSPLLDCPNLVVTPHMAGTGVEASARTALAVARKVLSELGLPDPDRTDSACQGTQA